MTTEMLEYEMAYRRYIKAVAYFERDDVSAGDKDKHYSTFVDLLADLGDLHRELRRQGKAGEIRQIEEATK